MIRTIFIAAFAAISLMLVGAAAGAKTVSVSITKAGYVANTATLAVGDTLQFTNNDTVAHQVTFKPANGVTCAPTPLVLQAAQAGSCTFAAPGTFTYSDPNVKGNTFRGTVTVNGQVAAETLTLAAKPQTVVYGGKATLNGMLSTQKVGENVDVFAKACTQPAATKVATVQTTIGGAYVALVPVLKNTLYTVNVKKTSGNALTVKVAPRVRIAKLAAHRYSLRVFAAQSFAGKYGTFSATTGRFCAGSTSSACSLRANSTGVAPTVISSVTFGSSVPSRSKVRVILPQLQVGSCHAPGRSNTILA